MFHQKMAETQQKDPALCDAFRMAVERNTQTFINSVDNSYDFPTFLSKDQRNFIQNYAMKVGLRSRVMGKGKQT